jgi:ABC-type phosphate transport system substrate-binding protein
MLKRLLALFFALMPAVVNAESIVVVVNPKNAVQSLGRDEVINIFLGGFRQFPSGLAAVPVDLPREDAARREFYRLLTGKTLPEINAYWARLTFSGKTRPPVQARRVEEAWSLVMEADNAIAYFERSKVDERLKIVFELGPCCAPE